MSKTSHGDENSDTDRFLFCIAWVCQCSSSQRCTDGLNRFSIRIETGERVYNGPTPHCDSPLKASVPSDMIERAGRNQSQLLSLPHFSAGYHVACWWSGFYSWSRSLTETICMAMWWSKQIHNNKWSLSCPRGFWVRGTCSFILFCAHFVFSLHHCGMSHPKERHDQQWTGQRNRPWPFKSQFTFHYNKSLYS